MRHRKHNVRFGRQKSHYKATMRHLVTGLIINKSISTTRVRAKEASRFAERLVTIGKNKTVTNQRRAYSILRSRDLVSVLFNDIAPLFKDRSGGYTRVMLTSRRRGDNAQMAILEFVEKPKPPAKEEKKKTKPKAEKMQEKGLPSVRAASEETTAKEAVPKVQKKKKEAKPQKEKLAEKKEEPKKVLKPSPEPEKPKEPKPKKTGFFKKFFGKKKDS